MSGVDRDACYRAVLDLQGCQTEGSRDRGIGRYSRSLAMALATVGGGFEFLVGLNDVYADSAASLERDFAAVVGAGRVFRYGGVAPGAPWSKTLPDAARLAGEWLAEHAWMLQKPDLIHISSIFEGYYGNAVVPSLVTRPRGTIVSATAYDVIPLLFEDIYLADPGTRDWYMSRIDRLRRCDLLLAISEATRRDLIERLGFPAGQVTTIHGAVDAKFAPGPVSPERRRRLADYYGLKQPFVMYTGGIDHRKNVEALIRAFALLPPRLRDLHQLAVVCSVREIDRVRLESLVRACGLRPESVVLTDFVPDEDLVELYRCCDLFVFPSMYEGFGLPVLEAMSCGAPTLAADASSLPEIVDRADALFRIGSDEDIAAAMATALGDDAFRKSLRASGLARAKFFTWKSSAQRARDAWREAIARRTESIAVGVDERELPARRRLALVSPLLPEKSGIADYVTELLPHLARHFAIDLFCSEGVDAARYRQMGFGVRAWQDLPTCWMDYGAGVFYQLGNSEFHAHMLSLLRDCPGAVLMHDAYLSGLMGYMEWGPPAVRGLFGEMLAYCHPGEFSADSRRIDVERAADAFSMSRWVADRATGVIVTSDHARGILVGQGQIEGARCAVVRHHRASRALDFELRRGIRKALGIDDGTLLVTSFGHAHERKCSTQLIDAFSRIRGIPQARLIFVGEADGSYGRSLRERAAQSNRRDDIRITGYVADEEFHTYLQASDIVVQLRSGSRGEASGALLYAMAYGLPVVASRHGTLAEIPDEACMHVADPVDPVEVAQAIVTLGSDARRRAAIGQAALEWIRSECDPTRLARKMATQILRFNDSAIVGCDAMLESRLDGVIAASDSARRTTWRDGVMALAAKARPRHAEAAAGVLDRFLARQQTLVTPAGTQEAGQFERLEPGLALTLLSDDPRLRTSCGARVDGVIASDGKAGMLLYGPYIEALPGRYRARVYGRWLSEHRDTAGSLEVVTDGGTTLLASTAIAPSSAVRGAGALADLDFACVEQVRNLEIRIAVPEGARLAVESLDLVSIPDAVTS